ncbi:Cytochrome p450 [Thalictrum thalictroides]|uniref:Cytochrome p450 n=1 Tax=Thalictrum thalictroides TaxID=46969 RepID=A0A7J6V4Z5_THATH|nr:Cytochrome p450 [Thalictrum thalictroides]
MGDLIPSLAWVNCLNGINSRVEKNFRDMDNFLCEVVEEHVKKQTRINGDGSDENEEEDLVEVMLGIEKDTTTGIPLTRDNTKAIILDMVFAGTDSSSVTLEWAMSELIRHPNIMEEVQKEEYYKPLNQDEEWKVRPCMFRNLKTVEIQDYGGSDNELTFIEIILKNALLLENITISPTTALSTGRLKKLTEFVRKHNIHLEVSQV